ncbi:MAG TPA: glycosyltransferase N-terminal domain-containing protein [Gemmatimonadales bacterium]|nr:glycosyltransferase N-terminal domain-containing protein [Gemmatimonadales bacterium]
MPGTSPVYRGASLAARGALALLAGLDPKLSRGHRGRVASLAEFQRWAAASRDRNRPLLWFHAPSVGEGLQASTVITRLRSGHPDWQFAYTYFSPSAESFAAKLPVDVTGYLPYDLAAPAETLLDALQPTALIFSKLDLWPEVATRAAARGVPVALIAATVRPGSGRLRWPVRPLLAPGYRSVSAAGAIAAEDAERLATLGVPAERIQVLGDPRFDSVAERVAAVPADDPLLRFGGGGDVLVAGSTWPGDEAVLLGAFHRVRERHPAARLILVPHEPRPDHLGQIEQRAAAHGLPTPVRLSNAEGPVPLLLVDRTGVLAALYGAGSMAFVGGGFHSAGLHSVLEPAAWGRPVAFGPRWRESRDAGLLITAGGGRAITSDVESAAIQAMAAIWLEWIGNPAGREQEGARGLAVVQGGLGAAGRAATMVESLVTAPR